MREQRRYIRYELEGDVSLKIAELYTSTIKAELVDISFLGMGIYSSHKIAVDTTVQCELITGILGSKPLTGKGTVKHVSEVKKLNNTVFRIGIEFTEIDRENLVCLINKIQEKICEESRSTEQSKKYPYR